jgi:membrane-associated phospholipid phosphatase
VTTLADRASRADRAAYRAFRTTAHTPAAERATKAFSRLGEHAAGWLAIGAAGAALDRQNRDAWIRGASVVAGAYVVNQAIKVAVRRHRPDERDLSPLIKTPTKLSFPSAHAASSIAAARAYGGLLPRSIVYPGAAAMALSRLYLGVHYPSDVAAGALLGAGLGALAG